MRIRIVLVLLMVAASDAQGQALPPAVRTAADAITAEALKRDLDYLSSDALRGRNTPSPGFDSAAAYIARRLQRAGVEVLGDSGTYFQHYELRDERIDTTGAHIEIGNQRFRFGDDFIMRSFAGPVSGQLAVVYVGHGWVLPDAGVDPYAGVDVRGKLLLVHGDAPPRGASMQQIGRVTPNARSPYAEADRLGAAGIIVIAPPTTVTSWDRLRRSRLTRLELHPVVPSAYASVPVTSVLVKPHVLTALLEGEAAATPAVLAMGDSIAHRTSFELRKRVQLNVPLANRVVHRPYNVVAVIRGSDPVLRNEYITIASHLDGSVGFVPQDGDSIYNAADDNATGSAGTLAIVEQLMKAPRPKRSLIFIWDSGEERGLWGTRHFVHSPPVPLDQIVAHFNIDMIGATRAAGFADSADMRVAGVNEVYLAGPGVLSASADSLITRVNRGYLNMQLNRTFDRADHEFFYPRTDAGPFLERGILTIGFQTGLHNRYHAPRDEAQYLDPKKMESIARTVLASVWMLADAPERPRIDKSIPPTVPRYR